MDQTIGHVLVPGTFDPITNGHLDVVRRACRIFPKVTVAVAESLGKNGVGTTFSLEERVELARPALVGIEGELQQVDLNYRLDSQLESIFVMSSPEYGYLSSSVVRQIAGFGGDVSGFVPPCVAHALRQRFA